jgi:hypothetical protein
MADHDETQKIEEDQGFSLESLGEKAEYHAFNVLCTSALASPLPRPLAFARIACHTPALLQLSMLTSTFL